MTATRSVVDFVLGTSLDDLSPEVLAEGRRCVTDGIGVTLAGSTDRCSQIVRDEIGSHAPDASATILGTSTRATAPLAARANGTAGHAMDFDDTQLTSSPDRIFGLLTHPTVTPLTAGLAVAERYDVSGAGFLEAFLVGFEVECKMAEAIDPRHYGEGFHSTATLGTYGAVVTASKLLGLDAGQLEMALGIAGSMASGIRLGFGTMTKPLHAGRAAENGITAAELAKRGFTSGHEPLEGTWGFFRVFGGGFEEDRLVGTLGQPHSIVDPGVSVKPYPSGSLGHPSMDAMLALVTDNDVAPGDIDAITFRAGNNILKPLRYPRPRNELEAKFCIPFILSSIALRRRAGIHEFTDEFVLSPEVAGMMDRVEVRFDEEIDAMGYDRMRSAIDVRLTDGRELTTTADTYRGGPERPLTRDELHGKFRECAALVLDDPAIDTALDRLDRLETLGSISELVNGLVPHQTAVAG
ncbi:MAG: MmgE/PrpD family protein [Gemmatimonadota bacterium]|nr:MmgE/PrpD family protein [Gemmatimonadota bacterium]